MDWNWKVLINLMLALGFLAGAMHLWGVDSLFAVGKRDPSMGRLFTGDSLRLLTMASLFMSAFAASWAWHIGRAKSVGFFDNIPGVILLLLAVVCLVLAFQKGEQIRTPAEKLAATAGETAEIDKSEP